MCREHWRLLEEKNHEKKTLKRKYQRVNDLKGDYDLIIGGSGFRCLLCQVKKNLVVKHPTHPEHNKPKQAAKNH